VCRSITTIDLLTFGMNIDPYELWWRALELSNPSHWSPLVSHYFLDVRGKRFDEWWKHCEPFFTEPADDADLRSVYLIKDASDYDHYASMFEEDGLTVLLDLTATKDQLLREFETLLRKKHTGKVGRPPKQVRGAEFSLSSHLSDARLKSIKTALDVYERRKIVAPKEKNPDVARALQIPYDWGTRKLNSGEKRVLSATISRYLKQAENLIGGVCQGVFPAK